MGKRLCVAAIIMAALAAAAPDAWADGDPASDVLATQPLFLPQDAGIPQPHQDALASLLVLARQRGYEIRAALVASPTDLGSVGVLWRQPQAYARFLGLELGLVYRGLVLVAMPTGFGLYSAARVGPAELSALAGIPPARTGPQLAAATTVAVRRLAAAAGKPLPAPSAGTSSHPGGSNLVPWLVFAGGAVLVGLAWAASLRARPLGSGRQPAGGT
jgi:hypothetical protein